MDTEHRVCCDVECSACGYVTRIFVPTLLVEHRGFPWTCLGCWGTGQVIAQRTAQPEHEEPPKATIKPPAWWAFVP